MLASNSRPASLGCDPAKTSTESRGREGEIPFRLDVLEARAVPAWRWVAFSEEQKPFSRRTPGERRSKGETQTDSRQSWLVVGREPERPSANSRVRPNQSANASLSKCAWTRLKRNPARFALNPSQLAFLGSRARRKRRAFIHSKQSDRDLKGPGLGL